MSWCVMSGVSLSTSLQLTCALLQICGSHKQYRGTAMRPQLLREALCTAPATQSALQVCRVPCLPRKSPIFLGSCLFLDVKKTCVQRMRFESGCLQSFAKLLFVKQNWSVNSTVCITCQQAKLRSVFNSLACDTKGSRGPAATTRAAAAPGGSVYCACHENLRCHEISLPGWFTKCGACHTNGSRGPAATTRATATAPTTKICTPGAQNCCACHEISLAGSPSAVPATQTVAAPQR